VGFIETSGVGQENTLAGFRAKIDRPPVEFHPGNEDQITGQYPVTDSFWERGSLLTGFVSGVWREAYFTWSRHISKGANDKRAKPTVVLPVLERSTRIVLVLSVLRSSEADLSEKFKTTSTDCSRVERRKARNSGLGVGRGW
jgi:hypothetical protein